MGAQILVPIKCLHRRVLNCEKVKIWKGKSVVSLLEFLQAKGYLRGKKQNREKEIIFGTSKNRTKTKWLPYWCADVVSFLNLKWQCSKENWWMETSGALISTECLISIEKLSSHGTYKPHFAPTLLIWKCGIHVPFWSNLFCLWIQTSLCK